MTETKDLLFQKDLQETFENIGVGGSAKAEKSGNFKTDNVNHFYKF